MENKETVEKTQATKRTSKKVEAVLLDDSVQVKVKSTYYGKLIYKNKRTGETTEWEAPGEVQIMTMSDLRAMKAEQVAFFKNQWVVILGVAEYSNCKAECSDIYKALLIEKYYENYIEPTDYRAICSWSEDQIETRIGMMTPGARENLVVALNTFIKDGVLDSIRKIKAFEKALGCDLYKAE